MKLCECGCGKETKKGNRFIHGHNRKSHYMLSHCTEELKSTGNKIKALYKQDDGPYGEKYKKKQSRIAKDTRKRQKETGEDILIAKKISEKMKGNKNGQFISPEARIKRAKKTSYTLKHYNELHPIFVKEESVRERKEFVIGEARIEVKCKFCRKWFVPTKQQIDSRIRAIEYDMNGGGCYLYCSEECKHKCPHFNLHILSVIKPEQKRPTSADNETYRQEVFKRSNHKCEYCGDPAIIVHHSRPFKLEPFFALDPDYGIAVCKKCNIKYAHRDECSSWNIANTVCK